MANVGYPCLNRDLTPRLRYCPHVPHIKQYAYLSLICREALYGGAAGGGKALTLYTDILTLSGWRKFGDLSVGDYVFGNDGKPTQIIAQTPVTDQQAFLLSFSDGTTQAASGEHRWIVRSVLDREKIWRRSDEYREQRRVKRPSRAKSNRNYGPIHPNSLREYAYKDFPEPQIKTTLELAESILDKRGRTNWSIDNTQPIDFPEQELPLDPYLFGAWLGDGISASGRICGEDPEIFNYFRKQFEVNTSHSKGNFVIESYKGLTDILRKMGVLNNKHVPEIYLHSSYGQRVALIQGMMDTDGTAEKNKGTCSLQMTRKHLVEDLQYLLCSLGLTANLREGEAKLYGRVTSPKWMLCWTSHIPMFRLKRKLAIQKMQKTRRTGQRYLLSIEKLDSLVPMKCVTVDNNNGSFLCGPTLLPTHNSDALLMSALQFVDVPGYAAMLMRRSLSDLSLPGALIPRSHEWLDGTDAHWDGSNRQWTFPSGAKLQFGYVTGNPRDDENALARYKSSEFQFIGMEESTEFAENEIRYMQSRLRRNLSGGVSPDGLTIGDVPLRMRYASNPGGPSHTFHKENFVHGDKGIFIQAFFTDNPFIDQDEYEVSLSQLSDIQQAYLRYGDWTQVEIPGALWSYKDIQHTDSPPAVYDRKILCVDPAGSNTDTSDETGIVIVGLSQGQGYVLEDLSGKYDIVSVPEMVYGWAQTYGCSVIRVEKDYGADNSYVMNQLRKISRTVAIDAIDSGGRSKDERATPVAQIYRQGRIWHTKSFPRLEEQMQTWIPGVTKKSPDRLDAMVYAFHDLVEVSQPYSIAGLLPAGSISGQRAPGLAGLL